MKVDVVDVTGLGCRGWAENAAGMVTDVGPAAQPDRYAELVLRVAVDIAFSARGLHAGFDNGAVAAWLESLGATRVRDLAVFRHAGRYTLHVSQFPEGYPMDYAAGEPVRVARRIDIDGAEPTWPECLNAEVFRPERSTFIFAAENAPTEGEG